MFKIVDHTIDYESLIAKVSSPRAGATSSFVGTVRNFTGDKLVEYLFYEAYSSMALEQMEKLAEDAKTKFDIEKVAIVHRIGKVNIGEASIVIAVSAAHRAPAIEACHYIIDNFKKIVPIWKKEFMTDGKSYWIANS